MFLARGCGARKGIGKGGTPHQAMEVRNSELGYISGDFIRLNADYAAASAPEKAAG